MHHQDSHLEAYEVVIIGLIVRVISPGTSYTVGVLMAGDICNNFHVVVPFRKLYRFLMVWVLVARVARL